MFDQLRGTVSAGAAFDPGTEAVCLSLASHRRVIDQVVGHVLEGRKLVMVLGEAGTGKTTLLASAMRELRRGVFLHDAPATLASKPTHLRQLAGGMHDPLTLQRLIGESLGVRQAGQLTPSAFVRVIPAHIACRLVLLIDDAQDLSAPTLHYAEMMFDLLKFSMVELQLVLFGRPGPWISLCRDAAVAGAWPDPPDIVTLEKLSQAESLAYLHHKLRGGYGMPALAFTAGARRALIRHAAGLPRELDAVAERALNRARRQGLRRVDRFMLLAAAKRLPSPDPAPQGRLAKLRAPGALALLLVAASLALAALLLPRHGQWPPPELGVTRQAIATLDFPAARLAAPNIVRAAPSPRIAPLLIEPPEPDIAIALPPPDRMPRVNLTYRQGDAAAAASALRAAAALHAQGAVVSGPWKVAGGRFGVATYFFAQDRDMAEAVAARLSASGFKLRAASSRFGRLAAPGTVDIALGAP